MTNSSQLWEAWILSKKLHKTPAEIYFITDELTAWSFNRAVTTFGMAVENDISESTRDCKNDKEAQRKASLTLDKWLREPTVQKFRDPAMRS